MFYKSYGNIANSPALDSQCFTEIGNLLAFSNETYHETADRVLFSQSANTS